MTKAIEEHYEKAKQRQVKIEELKQKIQQNKTDLVSKQAAYKNSVAEGDDVLTDSLFHEVEALQSQIKADEHKFRTLNDATSEFLKADAVAVVKSYTDDVRAVHQEKADNALLAVEEAKQAYIKALDVVDGIDDAFKADTRKYQQLIKKRNLTKADVNTDGNILLHKIEYPTDIIPRKINLGVSSEDIKEGGN
ncbi:hypothetical protein [Planomicrobium sp. YIM 101495]|uniref:hypothetical protein n=1 Tax=Planomicrobium sp. YIM 101495 TaxID=2665160 RepID=UPI0012B943CD|nr:hypothetical protein [Planomicrobium sp. YIM 101495]MTD31841.1 hypothetical protein [Planomicrobium sp. YIM 101495]